MLDQQLEDFATRERLAEALLGLLGFGDRVAALVALEREGGAALPDGPLADFFLGLISAGRTLRAALGAPETGPRQAAATAPRPDAPPPAGLLR